MENKNILILIAGIAIIFFGIRQALFEKKEVSAEDWSKSFEFESEDPHGAKVFYELFKQKYGEDNIYKNYIDTTLSKIESSNNLYVMVSHSLYLNYERQEIIKDFIAKGNDALIISSNTYSELTPRLKSYNMYDSMILRDSFFNFSFAKFRDSLRYKHFSGSNKEAKEFYPNALILPAEDSYTNLAYDQRDNSIFFKKKLDTGEFHQHVFPELFSNISAQQEFYLSHFNATFNDLNGEMIIIDHPTYNYSSLNGPNTSPLQYILSEPSLKWAYYLFLFSTIAYLIFRGKRKQRVIPIPEKNENTSIQYVDTLSDLFEQQNQNEKLVPHMQSVFNQRIKKKYYLAPDNEKYVELLSKKSKIPESEIKAILYYFKSVEHYVGDDQLIVLHKKLEGFYNNAE